MYPEIGYNYPFVLKSEANNFIHGEVYKFTNEKKNLDLIDQIEAYPILYTREDVDVKLYHGDIIKAIMYFKNENEHKDLIKLNEPIKRWTKVISTIES